MAKSINRKGRKGFRKDRKGYYFSLCSLRLKEKQTKVIKVLE
jgi:hypothetical protein